MWWWQTVEGYQGLGNQRCRNLLQPIVPFVARQLGRSCAIQPAKALKPRCSIIELFGGMKPALKRLLSVPMGLCLERRLGMR